MTTPEDHDLDPTDQQTSGGKNPDPALPPPGAKMSPEDILNVAKALSPKFFELAPDRLQNEATTESGLIVPIELTDPPL